MLSDNRLRSVRWTGDAVELIDQTRLPHELVVVRCEQIDELVDAIARLVVRGAPAIGIAGAFGVALASVRYGAESPEFVDAVGRVRTARPTAVNLAAAVDRTVAVAAGGTSALVAVAEEIRDEELAAGVAMGELGADLLLERCGDRPLRVMTICNTGGLATVDRGTALSVIQTLNERGKLIEALPLETRPLLQGARLTTWELGRMGAPYRLLVDSAAASVLARGGADAVVVGADRVAANGDTANKIGTFALALAARYAGVPFVVVAPETTLDPSTPNGSAIHIEERAADEVRTFGGVTASVADAPVLNPAFDVTPVELISALVTEQRTIDFTLTPQAVGTGHPADPAA